MKPRTGWKWATDSFSDAGLGGDHLQSDVNDHYTLLLIINEK